MTKSLVKSLLNSSGKSSQKGQMPVPVAPLVDTRYLSSLLGRSVRSLYGEDFLWPGGRDNSDAQAKGVEKHRYDIALVGSQNKYGRREVVEKGKEWILEDEYGGKLTAPKDETPRLREPALATKDELDAKEIPNFNDGRLEHIDRTSKRLGDRAYLLGGIPEAPFSFSAYLRGPQKFLVDLKKDPGFVEDLLEFTSKASLKMVSALNKHPVDALWIGDGIANGALIGPDDYREWALPGVNKLIKKAHQLDLPVFYHVCGKTDNLLCGIKDSGVDVFEVDAPDNSGMTLSEVHERTKGSDLVIKGNIDPLLVADGTKEEVRETAKDKLDQVGDSGRFILSTGCFLPEAPPKNIQAMVDAVK
mgnify:CR=1 FL=1